MTDDAGQIYLHFTEVNAFLPPKHGDLMIYHNPQIPGPQFEARVKDLEQAALLLDALAAYDDFQYANNIKPDYCSVNGLMMYEEGEGWCEWHNEEDDDWDTVRHDKPWEKKA